MTAIGLPDAATIGPLLVVYQPELFAPIDLIQLDQTTNESTGLQVDWTDHPVEGGQSITDFGVVQPETLSLTTRISGTPWSALVVDALSPTRVEDVPERIKQHARDRLFFSIQTRRNIIDDYVLLRVDVQPVHGEYAVDVTMDFKQIRLVASATVAIPPLRIDPGAASIAQSEVDAGAGAAATAPQSTAAAATDLITGLFSG